VHPTRQPVSVATLNGARLAFQAFGLVRSPTIVLVAGGASSMDWWDDGFCELLAAGDSSGPRRVVRYDLRDTGQSETVAPGAARYTGSDLVDDLAALVEHLGAAPAHVVGISFGGALVQRLMLRHPGLLASATLMSTTPAVDHAVPLPPPDARIAAGSGQAEGDPVATERLYSGTIPVDEQRIRRIAATAASRSPSPASAANHWAVADGEAPTAGLDTITTPTLVVHGSHDPLFPPAHGELLAESIPGARLVVVPGMGHQNPPPPTWPQVVVEILRHTAPRGAPGPDAG
jgi:pimeloyl-ACP methyl ester carboxylesterase